MICMINVIKIYKPSIFKLKMKNPENLNAMEIVWNLDNKINNYKTFCTLWQIMWSFFVETWLWSYKLILHLAMQSVPINTTKVTSLVPVHDEVYWIQHYALRVCPFKAQVCGFFRALWFSPPLKLTVMI